MKRILSLGGGVQSTAVLYLALHGGIPPIQHVIFADTGSERPETYVHISRLRGLVAQQGIQFHTVRCRRTRSSGNLYDDLMAGQDAKGMSFIPTFTSDRRMSMRQCTSDYKIDAIHACVRQIMGYFGKTYKGPRLAEVLMGISADEYTREKESQDTVYSYNYPLLDANWTRDDCEQYIDLLDYPPVGKSACFFCPYQSTSRWLSLKREHPGMFERAALLEAHLDRILPTRDEGEHRYLWNKGASIRDIVEPTDDEMFEDECAGVCGV